MSPPDDATPRFPRWMKIAVLIAAVAALLTLALMLLGVGGHGPARHFSSPQTAAAPHVPLAGVHG